jgi:hypothetical protein
MPSMPEPVSDDQDDNSAAEEIVLGVDTHKDIHVAAVITSLGVLRESTPFPATAAGYQALLAWAGCCGGLVWSAPAPTVQRWPGTCGRPGLR